MQIPILIEPVEGNGFRAAGGPPFALSAEGATREEALSKLRELIDQRIADGAVLMTLEVGPAGESPWSRYAGMFRDDPLFDPWQDAIAEYRQQVDEADDSP